MSENVIHDDHKVVEQDQLTDEQWYNRMQEDRKAKLEEAERKETELFDRDHPDFVQSAYEIILNHETLIPGIIINYILYPKCKEPTYKRSFDDFKVIQNKVRYGRCFVGDMKHINIKSGVTVQVVQMEWAWLSVIMKAADRGTMAGPHRPYSYHWIFIVWQLFLQRKDRLAEIYWVKAKKDDDTLDISQFYSTYIRGDYTYLFLQWFFGAVRKASDEDEAKLQKTLFPRVWLGPLATKKMYGTGPDLEVKEEEEWNGCGPMDGEAEVVTTGTTLEGGQSVDISNASMEALLTAFQEVDLDGIEMAAIIQDTGAMEFDN